MIATIMRSPDRDLERSDRGGDLGRGGRCGDGRRGRTGPPGPPPLPRRSRPSCTASAPAPGSAAVELSRPPITTTASGWEMKPPLPVRPSAIGSSAKMVAIAVIRIGRSRRRPPSITASRDAHALRPVLVDQVHQHDRVGDHDADQHQHADQRRHAERGAGDAAAATIAPVAANGIETSRISGWIRLRNVAAMTRKTIAMAASSGQPEVAERVGLVGADAAERVATRRPAASAPSAVRRQLRPWSRRCCCRSPCR